MLFINSNVDKPINIINISNIYEYDCDVIFESAKGSLDAIKEHYESNDKANARYKELQNTLLVK